MLPVIVGTEGPELSIEERGLFARLQPAGYILFSRNIEDVEQARELTETLRALTADAQEPILCTDQEGGRVVRTAKLGLQLPSAAALAAAGSAHTIRCAALYSARALHTLGINTVLAPVLDIATQHNNALYGRCWGADAATVTANARVWNSTMHSCGLITCGKHFPGMGDARQDPHLELPALRGTRAEMLAGGATEPFARMRAELPAVMAAHPVAEQLDPERPASLSRIVIGDFLRRELGYTGVVMTDDLCMGAITSRYRVATAAAEALLAGCDAPLICHRAAELLPEVEAELNRLPHAVLRRATERLQRLRAVIPAPMPPMRFVEWREYLRDAAAFCATVPEVPGGAAPDSPVQHY